MKLECISFAMIEQTTKQACYKIKGIGSHCSQFKKSELYGPTCHQKIWWGIKMNMYVKKSSLKII